LNYQVKKYAHLEKNSLFHTWVAAVMVPKVAAAVVAAEQIRRFIGPSLGASNTISTPEKRWLQHLNQLPKEDCIHLIAFIRVCFVFYFSQFPMIPMTVSFYQAK
jgi:hypothetical protein